jgi:hypothetical protein
MESLQWHLHTFESSSYEISDDDSDWDTSSKHSYQSHLDLRSHHCRDSTDSSGPPQTALDSFLNSVLPPEDRTCDPHYLGRLNPYDSDSIAESESSNLDEEYNDDELLILNTPEALYTLYHKNKLQSRIGSLQRIELLCPDCGQWCQTGVHSKIGLWADGHFRSFSNHRGSRKCEATAKKTKLLGN